MRTRVLIRTLRAPGKVMKALDPLLIIGTHTHTHNLGSIFRRFRTSGSPFRDLPGPLQDLYLSLPPATQGVSLVTLDH